METTRKTGWPWMQRFSPLEQLAHIGHAALGGACFEQSKWTSSKRTLNSRATFLNRQRSIHRVNDVTGCPSTYARPEDKWRRVVYLSVARRVASWEHVSKAPGHTDWPPQSTCS